MTTVNWGVLPVVPTRAWNDYRSDREKASFGVALLGLGLSAVSYYFISSPYQRIGVISGIASGSLYAIWQCMTPPAKTQEQLALELRQKAGAEIDQNNIGYAQFFTTYQDLLQRKILQNSDITPVLERDIVNLTYPQFMQKHAGVEAGWRTEVLNALPQAAKDNLRECCILALSDPSMTFTRFIGEYQELVSKGILKTTDITPSLERDVQEMDYDAFIKKHAGTGDKSRAGAPR